MILDKYENKDLYVGIHPLFAKCFEFADEYIKNPVPAGTYEIVGRDLYVMVQESKTKTQGFIATGRISLKLQSLTILKRIVNFLRMEKTKLNLYLLAANSRFSFPTTHISLQ